MSDAVFMFMSGLRCCLVLLACRGYCVINTETLCVDLPIRLLRRPEPHLVLADLAAVRSLDLDELLPVHEDRAADRSPRALELRHAPRLANVGVPETDEPVRRGLHVA